MNSKIAKVWRDGPVKLGRYREFWQADVDIAGAKSLLADAELIGLAQQVFDKLGLDIKIEVNNRKLLNELMKYVGVPKTRWMDVILTLDKLEKLGLDAVKAELAEKGLSKDMISKLMELVTMKGTNDVVLNKLEKMVGSESIEEIRYIINSAKKFGAKDVVFSPSLARGLAFYTGTVFEAFMKKGKIKSSLAGGGRYDEAVGKFSGEQVPCVGISFGIDVIMDVAKLEGKIKTGKTETVPRSSKRGGLPLPLIAPQKRKTRTSAFCTMGRRFQR